jgi:hypothetical protein
VLSKQKQRKAAAVKCDSILYQWDVVMGRALVVVSAATLAFSVAALAVILFRTATAAFLHVSSTRWYSKSKKPAIDGERYRFKLAANSNKTLCNC